MLLSVVVPVYNGGNEVVENVEVIRSRIAAGVPADAFEVVVVSDGSIDGSAERLLESRTRGVRVIHYDRNLGKGYAVKAGTLAARGDWIGLVDADLDLDPSSLPSYLEVAQREGLDFAIGSKRHPDSTVRYPRSRHIASWCYQQLNRILFRLDVRDTQVGLKVFHSRVADEVVPLLLVKQFAFDVELLAVGKALGFGRVQELPVRLEYQFTGSALGSINVLRALWDTAAVFYRLRVLRTYQRKRRLLGPRTRRFERPPLVSVIGDAAGPLDYAALEHVPSAREANGELLAVLTGGARPAGNWVTAAVPYFADADVAAVVVPTLAPMRASLRERVAAAVLESRLGGGSRRSRFFPGNVRTVVDHPAEGVIVRRNDYLAALDAGVEEEEEELVAWLSSRGRLTIYTPDASLAAAPPPLIRPHLDGVLRHARARGLAARRSGGRSLSAATALSLAPAVAGIVGAICLAVGGSVRTVGLVLVLAYAAALALSGIHAALRFRSLAVGLLEPFAVVASQAAYLVGFAFGLTPSFARTSPSSTFQSKRRA